MDFSIILESRGVLVDGLLLTIGLSIVAIVLGTVVGFAVAIPYTIRIPVVRQVLRVYIELFRGTPLLMQLFFVYFGLPYMGVTVDRFPAAVAALTVYSGAYIAEIIRAGIESVPRGQREASESLGLTFAQTMRRVIIPQAATVAVPPLAGFYIGLVKDTSLAMIIGYRELLRTAQEIIDRTGQPMVVYVAVALMYFLICFPLSRLAAQLEGRARRAT